jgi:hypothetical protein
MVWFPGRRIGIGGESTDTFDCMLNTDKEWFKRIVVKSQIKRYAIKLGFGVS